MYDCCACCIDVKLGLIYVKSIELGQEIKKQCFKI